LPFKKGGAAFAIEAGLPIVPVAVSGSDDVLPAHSITALPGDITVVVGEPIEVTSMTIDHRDDLTHRVRDVIESTLRTLEGEPRAASGHTSTVGAHA
jgi:1-acyl-sn-glycerol-3-phosphate acyltransferase